ncbi:MAG: carboxypeptidase M32, partial [Clostridia bacterium]|nr:carboxypeptidase M32 [Clostridia bacterium]
EDMAILGKHIHELTHSETYQELVCQLNADNEGLEPLEKKLVERLYEHYEKSKNLSAEFSYEMDMAFNKAYGAWIKAKKSDDFSAFAPSLSDVISYTRKAIDLRDRKYDSYYQACLDDNEKGASEAQLDAFFAALKERIVPLLKRIGENGKTLREDFLTRPCAIPQQEAFSRYLLEKQGLRKSALVLMTTEHPFTTNFGPKDVRVTTHYFEENFISNIFSTLHEGGHALFMQYEPEEFHQKHVDNGMSNAMHETISRFYENIIGRSEAFIHAVYPKLQELSGDTFADVTERELYEAVNIARPSLIRIESDELSYCLHIMVRYELEKAMMNGDITVDQVPEMWNRKYKEYLGVDVPSDSEGCLQDVHWTMSMGYFPSYALGNAYGAQILRRMQQDIDVFGQVQAGDLSGVLNWLKEHVFNCASIMTPDEWIRHITGEGLNVNYYLDYLEEKFGAIYGL